MEDGRAAYKKDLNELWEARATKMADLRGLALLCYMNFKDGLGFIGMEGSSHVKESAGATHFM